LDDGRNQSGAKRDDFLVGPEGKACKEGHEEGKNPPSENEACEKEQACQEASYPA